MRATAILAAVMSVACATGALAKTVAFDLRTPAVTASENAVGGKKGDAAELRTLHLAAGAAASEPLEVGDELAFSLFGDVEVRLRLKERMASPLGGEVYLAEAVDAPGFGSAVVMRTSDGVSATVTDTASGKVWNVYSGADGVTVRESDSRAVAHGCGALEPEPAPEGAVSPGSPRIARSISGKANIDILVAYDYAAAEWVEDNGGMTNFATLAVQKMNSALANTGLGDKFAFRLVDVMKVKTNAGNSVNAALPNLHAGSGAYAAVKSRRDAVGADIVTLLIDSDSSTTGVGYSLSDEDIAGFSEWAYNVCAIRAVASSHVMSHEVGHNMGAGHSDIQAADPGPQLYDYSSGYYFTAGETPYHTIMAYDSDGYSTTYYRETPYYSSPSYKYEGVAVGDAKHDNTRTLAQTYATVSEFRAEGGHGGIGGGEYVPSTWLTTRDEAFAAARAQGKRIFLIRGRDDCGFTIGTRDNSCENPAIKPRLAADYVLWYSNNDKYSKESGRYFYRFKDASGYWPDVAIIDPEYEDNYIVRASGPQSVAELAALLDSVAKTPFPVIASEGESADGVEVTWPAVAGASSYNVYRLDADDYWDDYPAKYATGVKATAYSDANTVPGHDYYYAVSAVVGGAEGPVSDTSIGYRRLETPQITSITGTTSSATIEWNPIGGAGAYIIYRATAPDAVRERIAVIGASEDMAFYTDWKYERGRKFYYSVAAAAAVEWIDWENEVYEFHKLSEESEQVEYCSGIHDDAIEGLVITGPKLIDLYDVPGGNYSATVRTKDGASVAVEPKWSVSGVWCAKMSETGELGFHQYEWSVQNVATATVSAVYGAYSNSFDTVVYGPGSVYVTECSIDRNTLSPTSPVTITPKKVKWTRHGVEEDETTDLSGVMFGYYLYGDEESPSLVEGTCTVTVPDGFSASAGTCSIRLMSRPARERYYSWLYGPYKTLNYSRTEPKFVTVRYDMNGGSGQALSVSCAAGLAMQTLPYPERKGYLFSGWYNSTEGGRRFTVETAAPAANTTLYAQWSPISYVIHFYSNGGTGEMSNRYFSYDKSYELPECAFERPGWHCVGWAKTPDGKAAYAAGESVRNLSDRNEMISLYAVWERDVSVTLTLDTRGGTLEDAPVSAVVGVPVGYLPEPERSGWLFDGWYTSATGGEKAGEDFVVTGPITLYAHWTPQFAAISYTYAELDKAKAAALKEGKLLFILYGADWCGFTSVVKDYVLSLGDDFTKRFVCCYIDGDALPDDYATMHAWAYPTYGVFDPAKFANNWFDGVIARDDGGVEARVAAVLAEAIVSREPQNRAWKYEISGGVAVVKGCEPADGELFIPATLGGKPVVAIKDYAFFGCDKLTSVTFPESVTNIGVKAFKNCTSLKRAPLPFGLKYLGQASFQNCTSLEKIEVPRNIDYLWSSTFEGCSALNNVSLPDGLTSIGTAAFSGCKSLQSIWIPTSVKQIKSFAFFSCESLWYISLPTNVTAVGEKAFKNCEAMYYAYLPESLRTLGKAAFFNTALTEVTVPGSVAKVDDYCFQKCPKLWKVTLSEGVRSTGASVFANDETLAEVVLPSTFDAIGAYSFFRCTALGNTGIRYGVSDTFTVPDSVKTIGEKAFKHCKWLKHLELGAGVTEIPREMCNYCLRLEDVKVASPGGVKSIGLSAFANCPALLEPPRAK